VGVQQEESITNQWGTAEEYVLQNRSWWENLEVETFFFNGTMLTQSFFFLMELCLRRVSKLFEVNIKHHRNEN